MHLHKDAENRRAPWFSVPRVPTVSVEHPYMISDIGKAIETLGGPQKTSKLVGDASASTEADLYFHPGDRNSKPVASFNTKTTNVLLKIVVPKRTSRKRKRGSDDIWQESSRTPPPRQSLLSDPEDARRLFRSMRDNPDRYRIEPLGSIVQTHRFRRLPDFVWSIERSPFMRKMEEHILPFEYPRMKNFKFDMSKGIQKENDLIPPPSWTRHTIPFNYSYRHNPTLKQAYTSDGLPILRSVQAAQPNRISVINHDAPFVPTEPPVDVPPESTLAPPLRALLDAMREIFARRPVGTRRSVQNQVPPDIWKAVGPNAAKHLWQYVGFLWNSGPWRDAICAFGVDPRKDKTMRWYQTVVFHSEPEPLDSRADHGKVTKTKMDRDLAAQGKNTKGHLFDGQTVRLDGKVWQMCDVSDPLVKSILDTAPLRDECDTVSDGWYTNGTWAKIKVIMKAKITAILAGDVDDGQLESELLRLHQKIPDILTEKNRSQAIFEKGSVPNRMVKWAELVRTTAVRPGGRAVAWGPSTAKKPRGDGASPVKRNTTSGRGTGRGKGRGFGGGRPRKQSRGGRAPQLENRVLSNDGQELIDPRLRDITGDVEDVAREAAMRAFEDDVDGSDDDDSSVDESSNSTDSDGEISSTDESGEEEDLDTDDGGESEESEAEDGESGGSEEMSE